MNSTNRTKLKLSLPRLALLLLCSVAFNMTLLAAESAPTKSKPNVIIFFLDDWGWADLGAHGSKDALTPNIDRLAAEGMRFTDGYISAPQCMPSRAGILTGKIQARFGFETNTLGPFDPVAERLGWGVPQNVRMFPDYMKELGYHTGIIGKWHLGFREDQRPMSRGFDEFFGFIYGGGFFLDDKWGTPLMRGKERWKAPPGSYMTDVFNNEAVEFIERNADRPFFLYVSHFAPHAPIQATKKYLERFAHVKEPLRRTMLAMLSAADDGLGEILSALERKGIAENTLIFALSDNGAPEGTNPDLGQNAGLSDPYTGVKGDLLEGGTRVPFIAAWKGHIPGGAVVNTPVWSLDILPTAIAAAGGKIPEGLDGTNILPLLTTGKQPELNDRVMMWTYGTQLAARQGDLKVFSPYLKIAEAFDLSKNPTEERGQTLPPEMAERAAKLEKELFAWRDSLPEPTWKIFFPEVIQRLLERYDYEGFEHLRPKPEVAPQKGSEWKMAQEVYRATRGFDLNRPEDFAGSSDKETAPGS